MVKKIASSLISVVILGSLTYADDLTIGKGFVGLEVGAAEVQADRGGFLAEKNYKGQNAEYGLRLGAQNESWRTMFVLDYFDSKDDNQNYEKGLLQLDYFLTNSDTSSFKPYIGLNAGYMNYESDSDGFAVYVDESGFLYGGQLGCAIGLGDTAEIDLMLRYSLANMDHADHIGSLNIGLNYLF